MNKKLISPLFLLALFVPSKQTPAMSTLVADLPQGDCNTVFDPPGRTQGRSWMFRSLLAASLLMPGAGIAQAGSQAVPDANADSVQLAQATLPNQIEAGICGGSRRGTYGKEAQLLAYTLQTGEGGEAFRTPAYETGGSKHNLTLMEQQVCQVGFVQSDVWARYLRERQSLDDVKLRKKGRVFEEHLHMACFKDLGLTKVTQIGDRLSKGQPLNVYVGAADSGGAFTLEGFKRFDEYKNMTLIPNGPDGDLDEAQNALKLAIDNKACAVWVKKAPDTNLNSALFRIYRTANLVDLNDPRFTSIKDRQGQPLYELEKWSKVTDRPELYLKMRQDRPDENAGDRDPYTIKIGVEMIVNSKFETDLLQSLDRAGAQPLKENWQQSLREVAQFGGDFSDRRVLQILKDVPIVPAPAPSTR